MNSLMMTFLSLSLSGSVLIAVLAALRPLYRNRLSRRWQYYIWLAVVLRLLLPFAPEQNLAARVFTGAGARIMAAETGPGVLSEQPGGPEAAETGDGTAGVAGTMYGGPGAEYGGPGAEYGGPGAEYGGLGAEYGGPGAEYGGPGVGDSGPGAASTVPRMPHAGMPSDGMAPGYGADLGGMRLPILDITVNEALSYIGLVWLAVAAALWIRKVSIYRSFVRFIKAGRAEVNDLERLETLGRVLSQEKVRGTIGLYTNPLVSSPMLIGFIRPFIVLPDLNQSGLDFYYTAAHETVHYKRADMIYKWLVQFAVCLHWFNPLVYRMSREINRLCELSCDEAVIRRLDEKGRTAYGDTLLNAVKSGGFVRDSLACITLHQDGELLKERLGAIMEFKRRPRYAAGLAVLSAAMVCGGSFAAGAYTGPQQTGSRAEYVAAGAVTATEQREPQEPKVPQEPKEPKEPKEPQKPVTPDQPQDNFFKNGFDGIENKGFIYTQNGYYEAPYVFELGWNVREKDWPSYQQKAQVTISDGHSLTVAFDQSYGGFAGDQKVLAALGSLLAQMADKYADTNLELERVLVVSVQDVTGRDLKELAGEYFQQGQLARFSAVFPWIDSQTQKDLCIRMFEGGKTAFFGSVAGKLEPELLNFCVEKAYTEDNISFFAIAISECGQEVRQSWADRASQDKRNTFSTVARESKEKDVETEGQFYDKDASGMVNVPVSLEHLNSGEAVCVAQVPDIQSARNFAYEVQAASGSGTLYVGIQKARREEKGTTWYHYIGSGQHVSYNSPITKWYDRKYSGPYCVYVESKYGALDNISGTVQIAYQ